MSEDFVFVNVQPENLSNNVMSMEVDRSPPKMQSMHVVSNVRNRYACTLVTSKYTNPAKHAQEATFSIVLPDTAFIAGFIMEIKGKKYEAYVKEKQAAKQEYDQAVAQGYGAAHVAVSARDSNKFTVSVNVEPQSDVTFILTYEELLVRKHGKYEMVVNLHPGQFLNDLGVDININETRPIINVEAPALRSGKEISDKATKNKYATIKKDNEEFVHISFHPSVEEQKEMANALSSDGFSGQFVVQYDVERDPLGGEVLVNDGYFVHFFAPTDLKPIPKYVVFVLDVSGSMQGRKIEQLKEAMQVILSELNPEDYFNIVKFNNSIQILFSNNSMHGDGNTSLLATEENIKKTQKVVQGISANGGTNISDALITALSLTLKGIKVTEENEKKHKPQPIIVFLTDGQANDGESNPKKIIEIVEKRNDIENKAAIFTLAFGDDANKEFLKELAIQNSGFLRNIYEASDASLQLQDFYKQISSPLLTNVNFKYSEQVKELTKHKFDILFNGSEFVVTGKVDKMDDDFVIVEGSTLYGINDFRPTIIPICPKKEEYGNLERLWAYMTIQQLLDKKYEKKDVKDTANLETPEKQALKLALKYSFVTPVTSLVVVKPETSDESDLQWGSVRVASSDSPVFRVRKMRGGGGAAFSMTNSLSSSQRCSVGSFGGGLFGSGKPQLKPESLKKANFEFNPDTVTEKSRFEKRRGRHSKMDNSLNQSASFSASPNAQLQPQHLQHSFGAQATGIDSGSNQLTFFGHSCCARQPQQKSFSFGSSPDVQPFCSPMKASMLGPPPMPQSFGLGSVGTTKPETFGFVSVNTTENSFIKQNTLVSPKGGLLVMPDPPKPKSMRVVTNIQNSHARTVVSCRYVNEATRALQTTLQLVVPDTTFITGFIIEINGSKYEGQRQKRDQAKEVYQQAVKQNLAAAHLIIMDSKITILTIYMEAQSELTFSLTYEELLINNTIKYQLITNPHPGYTIEDLEVDIKINDSKPILEVETPVFKSQNGTIKYHNATINKNNDGSVHVNFKPTIEQQNEIINNLKSGANEGISGQFIVEYKTETTSDNTLVHDLSKIRPALDFIAVKTN